jgi:hypothetical protein
MPAVGFEPTISVGERPLTHALDRADTGTSGTGYREVKCTLGEILRYFEYSDIWPEEKNENFRLRVVCTVEGVREVAVSTSASRSGRSPGFGSSP